jgi:NAD(P)-dependent dehydrogenase (short-subunit alcohol dehydrogenase family)
VVGSVTEADFPARFVDEAVATFGGLDIVVTNAGYTLDAARQAIRDDGGLGVLRRACHRRARSWVSARSTRGWRWER